MKKLLKKGFIKGNPYPAQERRGDIVARKKWSEDIKKQTKDWPKIKDQCFMRVVFVLPGNRFPTGYEYGPDLDNLLKKFQDALNETIFSDVNGKDSCITKLYAEKIKVKKGGKTGAKIEVYSL